MSEHLHFEPLFRGQTVTVTDVCCRPGGGDCGPEEYSTFTTIVFPRAGAFVRHVGRQQIVANSNHVLFFRAGETYRERPSSYWHRAGGRKNWPSSSRHAKPIIEDAPQMSATN